MVSTEPAPARIDRRRASSPADLVAIVTHCGHAGPWIRSGLHDRRSGLVVPARPQPCIPRATPRTAVVAAGRPAGHPRPGGRGAKRGRPHPHLDPRAQPDQVFYAVASTGPRRRRAAPWTAVVAGRRAGPAGRWAPRVRHERHRAGVSPELTFGVILVAFRPRPRRPANQQTRRVVFGPGAGAGAHSVHRLWGASRPVTSATSSGTASATAAAS